MSPRDLILIIFIIFKSQLLLFQADNFVSCSFYQRKLNQKYSYEIPQWVFVFQPAIKHMLCIAGMSEMSYGIDNKF
jgi:hypothetical protein